MTETELRKLRDQVEALSRRVATAAQASRRTPRTPTIVGKVLTASPAVGKFMMVDEQVVSGVNAENATATFASAGRNPLPVYLVGPGVPTTGDILECSFVNYRWIAERKVTSTASYTITVRAKSCGGVGYTGISIVCKDGSGTTVSTCTTATGSFGSVSCTLTVHATGTYTITATNSHGLTLTKTTTVASSGNVVQFNFIDSIPVTVTDCSVSGGISGATVHISAPGWSTTGTTNSGGGVTIYPTVDLTGLTVSAYVTYNGATSATKTINPTNSNCGSFSFSFATKASATVTGCGLALSGASVSFTGPGGETGSGTTDASGNVTVTMTPPIANTTGTFTATASKARFATTSGGAAVCGTATVALTPASGYVCVCDTCPDPAPTTLTMTDPFGACTLTYDPANNWWTGTMVRSFGTTYDNTGGACNNPQAADLTMRVTFGGCRLTILVGECNHVGNAVPCRTCAVPAPSTTLGLMSFASVSPTVTCPPGFVWALDYTMGSEAFVDDRPYEQVYGAAGTVVHFTVTE